MLVVMFVNKNFPATAHKYGHLLLNNADIDIQCITYWIVSWNYSYSFLSHKCSILTDHSHRTEFTQRVLVFIYILVCARHLAFKPNFHWSICSAVCYFYNYRSDVTSNVYLIQNLLTRRDDACTFIFISINNFILICSPTDDRGK